MKNKLFALLIGFLAATAFAGEKPNVILILTDDQGIGDLGCHGNPWIKTPNIDRFYEDAVRMTDFHVSPVCTPTRGAVMTGQYPINNGAWATYKGRDFLSRSPYTMAKLFRENGYRTGLFGKWHLGDNYPVRPTDVGFDVAVQHMSGGVGELSDYWGNNYFNDTYFVNNEPKRFEGYCTDIWFDEAMKFIDETEEQPFFVYLPTNAPHGPLYVDDKYAKPYRHLVGKKIPSAEFYGMITNIDENFGKLEAFLEEADLADNTILVYFTDNGTGNGVSKDFKLGYNMGLSGKKGSRLEGGHRVPFFIRWKDGKIDGGRDVADAVAHVDLIPTLAELCGLRLPKSLDLDGIDFSPVLRADGGTLEDRTIFVHSRQDWRPPLDIEDTCIVKDKWRLVNGKKLYDVEKDPAQKKDLAAQYPELVQSLLRQNEAFLAKAKLNPQYNEFPAFVIGNEAQREVKLTIQHAIGEAPGFWKCEQVAAGLESENNRHSLEIDRAGKYLIECRRWPKECSGPILGVPRENPKNWFTYETISPKKVRIEIANQIIEKPVGASDEAVSFTVTLDKGKTLLTNDFIEGKKTYGVYYTYITYLGEG